jgi:hypothetical protein
VTTFFRNQIQEIKADPALRWYGAAISLLNSVAALFWLTTQPVAQILGPQSPVVCWPFLESCAGWRVLGSDAIVAVVLVLFGLGVTAALLFTQARLTGWAYGTLAAAFTLKTALLLQDYRLVLNQHYMAAWVMLPFLFIPEKRRTLKVLIVAFYFWAGLLKLNPEWMSGAALYGLRPFGMPAAYIPAACAYVVIMELGIAPALLARRAWLFWPAFAQVLLFHLGSFWVVGFFYPILMFLILSIYVLDRAWPPAVRASAHGALPTRRPVRRSATAGVLAAFCACQLVPRALTAHPSVTGEGRLLALNMFDAPLLCRASATHRNVDGSARVEMLRAPFLQPRLACDPVVYFELAKRRCAATPADSTASDFDLLLETKQVGPAPPTTVVSVKSFCAANLSYSIWRHNAWINR